MEVDSDTGASSGKLTVDYVNEALDDFGCSLAMGCEDELVNKREQLIYVLFPLVNLLFAFSGPFFETLQLVLRRSPRW